MKFFQHTSPSPLSSCLPHNFLASSPTKAWPKISGLTLTVLHQVFVALAPPWAWWILPSHPPWKTVPLQLCHAILFSLWVVPASPLESNRKGAINLWAGEGGSWWEFPPWSAPLEPLQGRVSARSNTEVFASMCFHGDSLTSLLGRPDITGTSKSAWDMPCQNTILSLCSSPSLTVAQEVFHDLFLTHRSHWFIDISILRKCLDSLVALIPSIMILLQLWALLLLVPKNCALPWDVLTWESSLFYRG